MTGIVEVKEVSKYYRGMEEEVKKAVRQVSFSVNRGEVFSLLGPNGAGKTTLIKMLLGLAAPTGGEILVAGLKVTKESLTLREKLGYLPERVALYPNLSARETLSFFARLRGIGKNRCTEVLEKVGLADALDRPTGQFSKGMLQRLGLAQAILGKPEVLILDEPTSGLDPEGAIQFKQLVRQLNKEGITIIFSSHVLSEVQDLADRIGIMNNGKLIALGELDELGTVAGLLPKLVIKLSRAEDRHLKLVEQAGALSAILQDKTITCSCRGKDKINVLRVLQAAGGEITDFFVHEPTLEDVFLQYLAQEKGETVNEQTAGSFGYRLEGIPGKY